MRLLLDTNIFLEIILAQERAAEAQLLLCNPKGHELFLSDYSLHSIGILLFRRQQHAAFRLFLEDLITALRVRVASLGLADMPSVVETALRFRLDFDDAYQYAAAEKFRLTLISFDDDFDRTPQGRKTPAEILGG